jgi:TetR/AcrR family transcriptional regulator
VPQAPRRKTSGEQTRARILAAAESQFAERGYDAARLEDIAAEVGVRRAAIFYHFRDKRELYDAVLETAFDAFAPALPERGPAKVRMAAAIDAWIEYVAGRPSVARLILREAANARPGERSAMARIGRELVGWFRQLVQEGTRTGELTPSADPATSARCCRWRS